MKNIYGTIGYTVLKNIYNNNKIIILADKHDRLVECTNKTNISEWFKTKFYTSQILLEEIPIDFKRNNLIELWTNSIHTNDLKNLYLNNSHLIHAVDIRPFLQPFSIEIADTIEINNITLYDYLNEINNFFCLKSNYINQKLPNYNLLSLKKTKLGKHFMYIKKKFGKYLLKNRDKINYTISYIYNNHYESLDYINEILDNIMEWYICALIDTLKNKSIIVHTGLLHSQKVIKWLLINYDYIIINKYGINDIEKLINTNISGCVNLPNEINNQFGGFINNNFFKY